MELKVDMQWRREIDGTSLGRFAVQEYVHKLRMIANRASELKKRSSALIKSMRTIAARRRLAAL